MSNKAAIIIPWSLLLLLGLLYMAKSGELHACKYSAEDLVIRDIILHVANSNNESIEETYVSVSPKYSFDEIKPQHQVSFAGPGKSRVLVAFVRRFIFDIGAPGYESQKIEFTDESPAFLHVTLQAHDIGKNEEVLK